MKEPNKIDGNRRDLLKGLGIAAVVSLLPETGNAAQNNAAPKAAWDIPFTGEIPGTLPEGYNILLITCDQERYFERYPFPVPGRERLMKTGITFTNHQNTANVCTPSRSVMYTGLHMPHTRMFDNLGFPWMNYDLDPELRTVGHMMRELGYYTAYKGKWHLTREIDQPVAGKSVEEMDLGEIPTPRLHEIMEKYGFSDYHGIGDVIGKSKGGYFFDSVTTGQTISWLRNTGRPLNDENKPWFAAVNLVNPHDVMFIDTDEHGEQVQWLDNLQLTQNTIIVFTADHGELGGSHQMHGKGSSVYKEQIHVPMIIRHPAYPGNIRCNSLTNHLDLVPTLIGLTGRDRSLREKVLEGRKGRDMSPLLAHPEQAGLNALRPGSLYCYGMILYMDAQYTAKFRKLAGEKLPHDQFKKAIASLHPDFSHRSGIRMINDGHYKFARYFSLKQHHIPATLAELLENNDVELFDLVNDPEENHNLAREPEKYRDLLMTMNDKLNQLTAAEIGEDDGSYMPPFEGSQWDLTAAQMHQYMRD